MRVLFLTASISRHGGGLFVSVRRLAQCLRELGVDAQVVSFDTEQNRSDLAAWAPLKPVLVSLSWPASAGFSRSLLRCVRDLEPDIVHTQGLWLYPSFVAERWSREVGRPHMVSPRGMLDSWALANSHFKKRIVGWLYEDRHLKTASCIHALCASERGAIREYGLRNPVCVIPNGMDIPASIVGALPPWADKIENGRKVLLFLGRIHPKKGLSNLLSAWSRAVHDNQATMNAWTLVIAGWDQNNHEAALKKQTEELGIGGTVLFVGPLFDERKRAALENSTAFILPSFSEGLPMSVLEAWSYGLPVVMTPECNLPEGFSASAAVRIAPDVESICEGLLELAHMRDAERRDIGKHGVSLIEGPFSWPRIGLDMKAIYEWALGGSPAKTKPACVDAT
jgi:glycosyltransferase involved in cell wall biosynthesis